METLMAIYADINAGVVNRHSKVPREFNNNRQIKGVYMYIMDVLRPDKVSWEDVARRFCTEKLNVTIEGKGSTRIACRLIQDRWGEFVNWAKITYK